MTRIRLYPDLSPPRGSLLPLGQKTKMKLVELEVLSETSNHAVVRLPGRNFPGSVVQGDSLSILCEEAKEISERIRSLRLTDEEFLYLVQEHQEKLLDRLLHYQAVLAEHGITPPYSVPVEESDLVALVAEPNNGQS